ncbi:MAG: NAD(+)/NADH kinase [Nitrospinae bacterium]|nr:NAD(+)/NADH kinase [Nitrospinota bacterium]
MAEQGIKSLTEWLDGRKIEYLIDEESAKVAGMKSRLTKVALAREADLIIVLGGDGTFLSVARLAEGRAVPILGVNLGGLGFLTEFAYEEMIPALESAVAGDYAYEDRIMLDVSVSREGKVVASYTVLNDVVINRVTLARMVTAMVAVDGVLVNEYTADGLIVSTPTGSTAYNLSAGGPIIHPSISAIIISPICPHTLSNRPIVIPDNLEIELSLSSSAQGEALLTLDGQVGYQVNYRDRITIRKSKEITRIIQSPYKNYYQLLRGKLKWGETIRQNGSN